jgi:hypothetical protein
VAIKELRRGMIPLIASNAPGRPLDARHQTTAPMDWLSANEPDEAAAASLRLVLPMISTIAAASQC